MSNPQVHLCVKNSRVKKYDNKHYLQNGTEFQLELFNPTQKTIGAQIMINGRTEQSKLLIRPGERLFLDRFVDVQKKFKFDTYEIDGSDTEAKTAISKNGIITVSFYEEYVPLKMTLARTITPNSNSGIVWLNGNTLNTPPLFGSTTENPNHNFYCGTTTFNSAGPSTLTTSNSGITSTLMTSGLNSLRSDFITDLNSNDLSRNTIETGRVESGAASNQVFEEVDFSFKSYALLTETFQILPMSQKPEDQEVAMYCCSCGRKSRRGEKFCPKCGNNLELQRKSI